MRSNYPAVSTFKADESGRASGIYRYAELAWADREACKRGQSSQEWAAMTEDAMGIMERFGGTMTAAMGWDDEPRSSLLGHGARGLVSDVHLMATTTQPSKAPRNLIGIDDFVQWTDRGMRPDAGIRLEQRILDPPRVNLDILVADGRANRAVGARCDLARRRGTRGSRGRRPR